MNQDSRAEVAALRDEVSKLSRVITEVMGEEFDSIMGRQTENQQSTVRWFIQSLSVSMATMQLLIEHDLLDRDVCYKRVGELQRRLLEHAESIGGDTDIATLLQRSQDE